MIEIMIVGYDPKCRRYFTSSHCGEAFIDSSVWKNHGELQRGDVYRVQLWYVICNNLAQKFRYRNLICIMQCR